MKKERNAKQTQRRILDATHQILLDGGHLSKFSLDNVAKAAGVSKGGLMHHYASKEALLQAAAEDVILRFEDSYSSELANEADTAGKTVRAYIKTALKPAELVSDEISPILLTFLRKQNTDSSAPSRAERWSEAFKADDVDPVLASIVRFAVDGMLYTEVIDHEPIEADLREKIYAQLMAMVTPHAD